MDKIKQFIKNVNLKTTIGQEIGFVKNELLFREKIINGYDKILALKDLHKNKPAIVLAHGPSLLEIDKDLYKSYVKITCNDFQRISNFFGDDFKPDYWVGANSYGALKEPLSECKKRKINSLITIPLKTEFEKILEEFDDDSFELYPWLWEHTVFQSMLAFKYDFKSTYSRCNTVTNHMIALALFLGCNPIHVAGFDLSYTEALSRTGKTHAGYSDDKIIKAKTSQSLYAFDDPSERRQIINDLQYLCKIGYNNGVEIHNLSFKNNKLPYNLSFRDNNK